MKKNMNSRGWIAAIAMVLSLTAAQLCVAQTTWTVGSTADDGSTGTLRHALQHAADGDTIVFEPTILPGTIYLNAGRGPLLVDKGVTIAGPGQDRLTVDGQQASTVFFIAPGETVTISGLTIANGRSDGWGGGVCSWGGTLTLSNCTLSGNWARSGGGGVYNGNGTLLITRCILSGNSAYVSPDEYMGGGAVACEASGGNATLTIQSSLLTGNTAPYGGAVSIYVSGDAAFPAHASVTVTNSTLSDNSAGVGSGALGGGIAVQVDGDAPENCSATVTVENSALSGNSATEPSSSWGLGGAIASYADGGGATLTLKNSTLSGNFALAWGGAIANLLGNGGDAMATLENCTLDANLSDWGGAVANIGTTTLTNCNLSGNSATYAGGAILNGVPGDSGLNSILTVDGCTFSDNTVLGRDPSGLGGGGAICSLAYGSSTTLTVRSSTLSGNTAWAGGAIAIYAVDGLGDDEGAGPPPVITAVTEAHATVVGCTLTANKAWVDPALDSNPYWGVLGGAIMVTAQNPVPEKSIATLTVDRSTLNGNAADGYYADGGALFVYGASSVATTKLANSTLSGNSAQGISDAAGGAMVVVAWPDRFSTATAAATNTSIRNCTLSNNFVTFTGGGTPGGQGAAGCIRNWQADMSIDNCTLAGNRDQYGVSGIWTIRDREDYDVGGALAIKNTILANDPSGKNIECNGGTVTSLGHNLCSDDGNGNGYYPRLWLNHPTDLLNTNPMLGPLADNGGPTWTHALLPGSPAIDAADSTDCTTNSVTTDQRGVSRPQGSANDIGAYELEAARNQAPVLSVPAEEYAGVLGKLVTFAATATDPDPGDTLAFSSVGAPLGAAINPVTGVFTWTPAAAGTFLFAVMVNDAGGLSDSKIVTVNVSSLSISHATIVCRNPKSITVTVTIANLGAATAFNVNVTAASLDGAGTKSDLPLVYGAIKPGASKKCTLQFKNVPSGTQTLTVRGTCSLGDFFAVEPVAPPVSSLDITGAAVTARNCKAITVTMQISNPNAATACNVVVTAASLDGEITKSVLPLVYEQIKPGANKKCTLQFKNVPSGTQTLTVRGTCSLGDFLAVQPVVVH